MSAILSREDWMRMRAGRHAGDTVILDRHDKALRARLAEVEAERDKWKIRAVEMLRERDAAERRLAEVERLLLRQTNLNTEAITQRMAAEARLAEVEQALRDARLFTSKDYIAVGRAGLVVQMGAADDILAAVLDKEEHG